MKMYMVFNLNSRILYNVCLDGLGATWKNMKVDGIKRHASVIYKYLNGYDGCYLSMYKANINKLG
ncbi:hypothetical protein TOT_030000627 [Theileria orientalis strain Shintoku]|uniref:Uncharacterized protein n=2 Tax=Theileria orientalis strain Shintoku TaxID=869250 RepID=J4D9G3_THEOR|nr:hypothetical protein TOT_030000625 [Theileria orientalis strain Shintoku]XP_009691666.1 hypothetical protein TOT_030000627 [Theileria orientalis strain Shintoku]BAM41363.1 hypothetical protein TOT_030000625 [Theileria orientalis strain Shintoku]BAM41365.1 hypothetical protein TOT_030000627 [Theileria orientalis strain Shintoku]|eukprot:XP_009691664.1 hypothetical protein TOT_030000625 [Theileria orientalis strain Shintoku]